MMYKTLSDEQLVALVAQGSNRAFNTLVGKNQHKLRFCLRNAFSKKGTYHEEIEDDVLQDVWLKVYNKLQEGKYKETGFFSAWLTRIAINQYNSFFRQVEQKLKKLQQTNDEGVDPQELLPADESNEPWNESPEPVDEVVDHEAYEALLVQVVALVDELPERQSKVVRMRELEGLPFKTIAAEVGVSENTAISSHKYGLKNLRKLAEERHLYADYATAC
ncbi:MAG: RNA polymerase sigma factor [Paludibacteraceae bacterium]|nr:RNA polymerase sigma factor [Paludibacteraceae bacterium]